MLEPRAGVWRRRQKFAAEVEEIFTDMFKAYDGWITSKEKDYLADNYDIPVEHVSSFKLLVFIVESCYSSSCKLCTT